METMPLFLLVAGVGFEGNQRRPLNSEIPCLMLLLVRFGAVGNLNVGLPIKAFFITLLD